jgi:hypothetical protein
MECKGMDSVENELQITPFKFRIMKKASFLVFSLVILVTTNSFGQTQKGLDLDGVALGNYFGNSVSMPDVNTVAIGAPYNSGGGTLAGHVRVYN